MKKIIILCFVFLPLFYCNVIAAEKANVAVLDFTGKNIAQEDASIINEYFRSELIKTGSFNVLDRRNINRILDEQKIQKSGITDVENAVKIGKILNVHYVFVGTCSKLDNLFMINVEMINIQTGKIEKSESRSAENPTAKTKLYNARFLAYSFSGFAVGYELFWDGNRMGFEPEWSREQAEKSLEWNKKTYPDKKVEGFYNGIKMQ
jgi:hypothetical protein